MPRSRAKLSRESATMAGAADGWAGAEAGAGAAGGWGVKFGADGVGQGGWGLKAMKTALERVWCLTFTPVPGGFDVITTNAMGRASHLGPSD